MRSFGSLQYWLTKQPLLAVRAPAAISPSNSFRTMGRLRARLLSTGPAGSVPPVRRGPTPTAGRIATISTTRTGLESGSDFLGGRTGSSIHHREQRAHRAD